MYEKGLGVEQSYEKAIEYYQLAVKQGDKSAQEKLDELYRITTASTPDPIITTQNDHEDNSTKIKFDNKSEESNKENTEIVTPEDNSIDDDSNYSFKNDYDAIERTAQSLFYVEMYDSNKEWLGTNASGFVSFDEHVFITNQHVIDGASYLKLWDEKDNMYLLNKVIVSDKIHDIAILLFPDGNKYTPLKLRTELNLQRGQPVITIGSPRGLQGTVDDGVISAIMKMKEYGGINCIQFSASISPGSSGGALFDNAGYVLGITTFTIEGQNLNFAIPITEVQRLYNQWDKKSFVILGSQQSWDTEGLQ